MSKIILIFIALLALALPTVILIATEEDVMIKVNDKERVVQTSGDTVKSKYLIYTENEVFENTDSLIFLKWNSSDVYNRLKEGEEYSVHVSGWRIPFLSWYRNIIRINP